MSQALEYMIASALFISFIELNFLDNATLPYGVNGSDILSN